MPFKKVTPTQEVENRIKEGTLYENDISAAKLEYDLIKNLVKIREELGITQKQIAEKTSLNQQMVSRIEKYGNSPRLDNFLKYVNALGLRIKFEYDHELSKKL